ncbi:MAG TPA: phosphotransferase [Candidatus Binatia bacterium]|nr:phosphotransferase [Candidatus Binatia bacterium]
MADPLAQLIADKSQIAFGASAAIESVSPLAGDASSRRYYRVRLRGAAAPPSLVVMELPAGSGLPLSSEELAIFKEGPKEWPFLNVHRFLTKIGVAVPRLYGHWEKDGLLFLEDLGDTALWDRVQELDEQSVKAWYLKAIDELLRLQLRGTKERDESCIAFQQRFDFKLYMWELDHFIEYAIDKRPGARANAQAAAELRKTFAEIARLLDRQTPCLSHRDYHSWNLMIHEEAVRVIDFQDALLAPPQYDLASLLNDRVTDSVIKPRLEKELVRYYVDRRAELDPATVRGDEFFEIYRLSAVQRDLKVVGRFYYLDQVKGKPGYLKFIPPTVRRLKRNLAELPQTRAVLPLLSEHFEAML